MALGGTLIANCPLAVTVDKTYRNQKQNETLPNFDCRTSCWVW